MLHLRGITLPDEVERDLYIDGDRIREDPVAHAETVATGVWIVPGLVDMHTHPGAEARGQPFALGPEIDIGRRQRREMSVLRPEHQGRCAFVPLLRTRPTGLNRRNFLAPPR
jgi:hypothetical protein